MPAVVALPMAKKLQLEGLIATFVVPAPNGCNLNCPFCLVRARREAPVGSDALAVHDYVAFLDAVSSGHDVGIMSLQGYEPLLPESWEYSKALLERATRLGIATALVTNGTYLREHVADLVRLDVAGITVSLDSATSELHDRSRGTPGAYAAALEGLKAAAASALQPRIMVASVLQPRRAQYLHGMPQLLASLGITQWVVSPLLRVGRDSAGRHVQGFEDIASELLVLQKLCRQHGVEMVVDDEFDLYLRSQASSNVVPITLTQVRRLPPLSRVVRLSPDGSCSVGEDVLRRVDARIPCWKPETENALSFVERALA